MNSVKGLLLGWKGYAAVAAIAAAVAFSAGWRLRTLSDAPIIAAAEVRAATAEGDLSKVNAIVARAEAAQERRRAEET